MGQFEAQDFDVVVSSDAKYIDSLQFAAYFFTPVHAKLDHVRVCLVPFPGMWINHHEERRTCSPQQWSFVSG
jgi:hypothetical protein